MKKNLQICIAAFATAVCLFSFNILNAQKSSDDVEWVISVINLEDNNVRDSLQNIPVFEDANINCLLNSKWAFLGDGEGYYKIDQANSCTKGIRQISWKRFKLKGSDFFQFYRTSAAHGVRVDEYSVYICEVSSSNKETFTLRYPILFNNNPNAIVFTFIRKV